MAGIKNKIELHDKIALIGYAAIVVGYGALLYYKYKATKKEQQLNIKRKT